MTAGGDHPSLERRLIVRLSLLYVAAIMVATAGFIATAWVSRDIETAGELAALARDVGGAVSRGADGVNRLRPSAALTRRMAAIPQLQLALAGSDGRVIEGSTSSLALALASALAPNVTTPVESRPQGEFNLVVGGRTLQGVLITADTAVGPVRLALVRGLPTKVEALRWVAGEMVGEVLPVMLPVMLLTLVVGVRTVRSVLAPFERLSRQLASVGPRTVGPPLSEDGVSREMLPMLQAVNRAFERLDLASQQQRRMTANAAHELRTPLAILRARIECLTDGHVLLASERSALERDVARMARLVEQLLAVARLEAGQVVVEDRIDLVHLARETLADWAPLAMAQGRFVALSAPEHSVIIRGNAQALGDALVNLLDNALRYTAEDGVVEVGVDHCEVAAGGVVAILEVRDRGPGVALADRAQLFEPFWRGRDRRDVGSGLGLAIVAETVAVHGGVVTVLDRVGGGSVFRIEMPGQGG